MASFPYSLQYIECKTKTPGQTVEFTVTRPFILLDSVVVKGPSTNPFNNLLLSLRANAVYPLLSFVDVSEFVSNAGVYLYTALPCISDSEAEANNQPLERQFAVVLIKNF